MTEPRRQCGGTVLLIAYHFPPIQGSSGVQRTLRFAQHLPAFGWRPIVLTIDPRAYPTTAPVAGNEIPAGLDVRRAFGLDTARHLSIGGRYPLCLALPDRWTLWRYRAVPLALRTIQQESVDVVWSTFPIATAHRIARDIVRRSDKPWVAEFRDPMWQGDYPVDPAVNRCWKLLEQEVCREARGIVVTTPGSVDVYRERFAELDASRFVLIENGYDESIFVRAEASVAADQVLDKQAGRPVKLLHSGLVYPSERDPTQLFGAIAALKQRGRLSRDKLQVVLRACGNEDVYASELNRLGIADVVRLEPAIDYLSALRELVTADGLLILQASNCNAQIPAKLYEYLRAGRPILALTDPAGDTAKTLESIGVGLVARLDSQEEIEVALPKFLDQIKDGCWRRPSSGAVAAYSRESQAQRLGRLLDEVVANGR